VEGTGEEKEERREGEIVSDCLLHRELEGEGERWTHVGGRGHRVLGRVLADLADVLARGSSHGSKRKKAAREREQTSGAIRRGGEAARARGREGEGAHLGGWCAGGSAWSWSRELERRSAKVKVRGCEREERREGLGR